MNFKLKYKIALLQILVGGAILLFSAIFNYKYVAQPAQQQSQEALQKFSKEIAHQVSYALQEKTEKITVLASAPIIEQALLESNLTFSDYSPAARSTQIDNLNRQWMMAADNDSPFVQPYLTNPIANYFAKQFNLSPGEYGETFLTNRYGALVASTGKLTTLAHSHKYWWKAAYNDDKGGIFLDDRGFDESVKKYVLGIVVPIKKNGHVIGILKSNILLQGTIDDIFDSVAYNNHKHFLVRDNGTIVVGSGINPLARQINPRIKAAFTNGAGGGLTLKEDGTSFFAAFSPVLITQLNPNLTLGGKSQSIDHYGGSQGGGWNVVSLISQANSLQQYEESERFFYLSNVIIVLLLGLVAFYTGRLIAKPLASFSATASKIGNGDFDINLPLSSHDELNNVAQSLNQMSKQLATTMATKNQYQSEIKQRKDIEVALRDSEAKLKEAQRIAKIGNWQIDVKTKKVFWSDEVFRLFDLTQQQFGANYDAFIEQVHPEDRKIVDDALSVTLAGEPVCKIAHRILLKDGSIKYVQQKAETIYDDLKTAVTIIGTAQDITEQHLAEEALLRYKHILTTTSDLMSFIDLSYTYITVNQAYLDAFEKTEEEIIGHSVQQLIGAEVFENVVKNNLDQCFSGDEVRYQDWFNLPTTGSTFLDVRHQPYYAPNGKIMGVVVSARDITEIKQAEAQRLKLEVQLRQKYKLEAIGVMAGGISHNFNNNLSIILGNIELAQLKLEPQSEIFPMLDNAKKAIIHSRDLVQQILNYSHAGDHRHVPTSLPLIINETVALLNSIIPSTINVEKNISKSCHRASINGNAAQIQEVLVNLCNNAVHAMDEHGTLDISLSLINLEENVIQGESKHSSGCYAKLEIKDNGSGMTEAVQARIFDLFFSTKADGVGTGVGLSTVQEIVSQHGAFINVESEVDMGTTFTICFPVIERRKHKREVKDNDSPRVLLGTEKIIFLDDNENVANVCSNVLGEYGYQVTCMTDSAETLKLITANPDYFDLLITDQTMPQLSGIDIIKKVLAINPDFRTVLVTGYSTKIDAEKALAIGAKAFCLKPLDAEELLQTVRNVLDKNG